MQLALTPEVLFPLVAGAAVVIAVIAVVAVLGRGRRRPAEEPAGDLTAADWTGEAAAGDPAAAVASRVAVVGPHRLTVAEAVAVREADTAPLPVTSAAVLGGIDAPAAEGPAPVAAVPAPTPEDGAATPEPGPSDASTPPPATPAAGSGRTMAAAVAQALAARAAAREASELTASAPPRVADARDRLLAVLLDDPQRAVGALEELEESRGQLGDVLRRLVASGLSVDQLVRLSGFPVDDVRGLLAQHQRLR